MNTATLIQQKEGTESTEISMKHDPQEKRNGEVMSNHSTGTEQTLESSEHAEKDSKQIYTIS